MCFLLVGVPLLTARVGVNNALGWWLEGVTQALQALQRLV
jgi:hypothetical protein